MGFIFGCKVLQVVGNLEWILGIEFVCVVQVFDFCWLLKLSLLMENLYVWVWEEIVFVDKDWVFVIDLDKGVELVWECVLIEVVKQSSQDIGIEFDLVFENC